MNTDQPKCLGCHGQKRLIGGVSGMPYDCPVCCPTPNQQTTDMVNHPPHYTSRPSGVECITVTEHMSFCIGNAIKYLWRADEKGSAVEDLEKARWYITREIERRKKQDP